jgi:hypothetical protein
VAVRPARFMPGVYGGAFSLRVNSVLLFPFPQVTVKVLLALNRLVSPFALILSVPAATDGIVTDLLIAPEAFASAFPRE